MGECASVKLQRLMFGVTVRASSGSVFLFKTSGVYKTMTQAVPVNLSLSNTVNMHLSMTYLTNSVTGIIRF